MDIGRAGNRLTDSGDSLTLRFAVEVVFRTLHKVGDTQRHCNDAKITAQSGKSFDMSCRV